jgi:uncharacterized protein YecE (DUF72 family)
MEFGRVTSEELNGIDFGLPPDWPQTDTVLKSSPRSEPQQIFIGCAKWGRKDWIGKIYPKGTKEGDFLEHYARHFNSIELNASFYRIPTYQQTSGWRKKVGKDFKFCPKVTGAISHIKRLKDAKDVTDRFLEGISGFEENLGPVFLMPHPGMGPKSFKVIESFIQGAPKDIQLFVELRHADWFSDRSEFQRIFDMLQRNNTGFVITDASGRRDCVHMALTTPDAFIRFVGNGLHPTDYARVDEWVNRIRIWLEKGIRSVYFFMHQHEELHSPALAKYVIERINEVCGLQLKVPQFIT